MSKVTAHEYIRESAFFTARKNSWIRPLVEDVLRDELTETRIAEYVKKLFDFETEANLVGAQPTNRESKSDASNSVLIKRVKSVDNIKNIGLLNFSEPIQLKEGLNVFYGKNGAGKSSLYLSICNTLGVRKKVFPNLNSPTEPLYCQTTVETTDGKPLTLSWDGKKELEKSNIKVLDSEVCMHLVEKDQPNEFELSHLKAEYFRLVSEMLDKVEEAIVRIGAQDKFDLARAALSAAFPSFLSVSNIPSEKEIKEAAFTEIQAVKINEHKSEVASLNSNESTAIVKNIEEAIRSADAILISLCDRKSLNDDDGPSVVQFDPKIRPELIGSVYSGLAKRAALQKTLEEIGSAKLTGLLPADWLANKKWADFIRASLAFVLTLDEESKNNYETERCLYCQQELLTDASRSLIKAYHEMQNTTQGEIDEIDKELHLIQLTLTSIKEKLAQFKPLLEKVNGELSMIGESQPLVYPSEQLEQYISEVLKSLKSKSPERVLDIDFQELNDFLNKVRTFRDRLDSQCVNLKDNISKKDARIREVNELLKPLEFARDLFNHKNLTLEYLKCKATKDLTDQRRTDLTSMRQLCSTLATRFTKEVPLGVFQTLLQKEYKALKFSPPESWSIKSATSGKENKRIYSLKDRRLSEIFSEGERKIHAFADFLAQSEMNKFQGIYIMDDPVNSLDEEKMECIRDRIDQLVAGGNQVIVFTHNLVFLNLLVDTSKDRVVHIDRLDNQVIVEPDSLLGTEGELKRRRKEIDRRAKEAEKNASLQRDEYFLRNIYDLISGYIESYVEIKVFKDIINRYRPNIRMHSLSHLMDFNSAILAPIIALYSQTSRKGSRHSQPTGAPTPSYEEFKEHYKTWQDSFCK